VCRDLADIYGAGMSSDLVAHSRLEALGVLLFGERLTHLSDACTRQIEVGKGGSWIEA